MCCLQARVSGEPTTAPMLAAATALGLKATLRAPLYLALLCYAGWGSSSASGGGELRCIQALR